MSTGSVENSSSCGTDFHPASCFLSRAGVQSQQEASTTEFRGHSTSTTGRETDKNAPQEKKSWTAQEDEEIIRIKLKNQKINQYLHERSNEYLEELGSTSHRNFSTPSPSDRELVFYFFWNYILFFYNFVRTLVYIPVFLVRI